MRRLLPIVFLVAPSVAALLGAAPGWAQWKESVVTASKEFPVLTLDQEKLFQGSDFGKSTLADYDTMAAALAVENRRKEAELESEERVLTQRRASLTPAEFANLANSFDARVVEIRARQDAKSQHLAIWLDQRRDQFFTAVLPVLADVLTETGAVAILQSDAVLIALTASDVTNLAIERANAAIALPDDDLPHVLNEPEE